MQQKLREESREINLHSGYDVIVAGGGVSLIGDPVISRLRKYTHQYTFINATDTFEVVPNELGEDVVLVGAMLLAGTQ